MFRILNFLTKIFFLIFFVIFECLKVFYFFINKFKKIKKKINFLSIGILDISDKKKDNLKIFRLIK